MVYGTDIWVNRIISVSTHKQQEVWDQISIETSNGSD